jgi:transposase
VAKEFHWAVIKVAESGQCLANRRVNNEPGELQTLLEEITAVERQHGPATVGLDVLGGIARLVQAMLLEAGLRVVHLPGLAVNRARRATVGGERKSDPKDAEVIADQVRMRTDLRPVTAADELDVEPRLLVGRRRELVTDSSRRLARLRDLLSWMFPGLERVLDVTGKGALWLLAGYVTPAQIRAAGAGGLTEHLARAGSLPQTVIARLVQAALAAADAQRVTVPGQAVAAGLVGELAAEALEARTKLTALDRRIQAVLGRHPDAAVVRSLPGMGAALTAEFLAEAGGIARFPTADQLASAAGLAPVPEQSGKIRYLQRPHAGNKALKCVFYQSVFCAIQTDPTSRAYYRRKRAEHKPHHQALISLARRRVNVLHAMFRTRQSYRPQHVAA